MRIYLAAPWTHRDTAREVARDLVGAGHSITAHWWEHREVPGYLSPSCPEEEFAELAEQAILDLDGVTQADVFVLLNTGVSEGKAVEMGVAIASGVPIILVGTRSNLFHYADAVEIVDGIDQLLMALDHMEAAWAAADESSRLDDLDWWEAERNGHE